MPAAAAAAAASSRAAAAAAPVISVAPMVDVTTRHFRYLIRLLSNRTTLYTPMYAARRLATRKRHAVNAMIAFHPAELGTGSGSGSGRGGSGSAATGGGGGGLLAAQLGGDDVRTMLTAARKCIEVGYPEININLGCPARSAQAGRHGAMLMRPDAHDDVITLLKAMVRPVSNMSNRLNDILCCASDRMSMLPQTGELGAPAVTVRAE